MFYDGLLLAAVWYLATAVVVFARGGEAVPPHQPWFTAYLLAIAYLYFAGQWAHRGQTLGMKTWRLRLVRGERPRVGWPAASLRFAAALLSWLPLGLGFFWSLLDEERLAWHDRLSGTRLSRLG